MAQVNEADGVRVVMSPVQLVAVLNNQSIDPGATISNRLWGGLQLVGGVLEMFGAGVLCALPEPTGVSKAGCVVFGVHGSDTAATGLRQIWTGRDTATLTQQGATKLAEAMRASPDLANNIGLSLDIGVGFGVAGMVKAARVSSITMGRISLARHERQYVGGPGGHTLEFHVDRTQAQLLARLKAEPRLEVASSFKSLEAAERAISWVIKANAAKIRSWAAIASTGNRLKLEAEAGADVGYGLVRATGKLVKLSKVRILLEWRQYNGMPYYIVTAYVIN